MPATVPTVFSSTTAADQKKYLHAKLLRNAHLTLVCRDICEKVTLPQGSGTQATFVRYQRMNLPQATITEGVDPNPSTFTVASVTVSLDQWGDYLVLSDIVQMTTNHPVVQRALQLLADNAARVMDREVQIVWLAGTNVTLGDGTPTNRSGITAAMKMSDTILARAHVNLVDGGAAPRGGPNGAKDYTEGGESSSSQINGSSSYIAVAGPQVLADIQAQTANGSWIDVSMYNNSANKIYNREVGRWMGIRWIMTNFIPKFTMLGNTTAAVASGAAFGAGTPVVTAVATGGALPAATGYWFKVTRKRKDRGFEEDISMRHSMTSAGGVAVNSFSFNFTGLSNNYVYNVYFGTADADASLYLASSNIEAGTTVVVTAVPAGVNPPANVNTTDVPTIHPVYLHGADSCAWVGLQNLRVMTSKDGATTDNPLELRKTLGYKFMAKTVILNQMFMLRFEVASGF